MASSYSTVRLGRIRARGRNEGVWGGFGAALSALSASVGQKCAERWIRHDRRVLRNKMFFRACTEKDREVSLFVGKTTPTWCGRRVGLSDGSASPMRQACSGDPVGSSRDGRNGVPLTTPWRSTPVAALNSGCSPQREDRTITTAVPSTRSTRVESLSSSARTLGRVAPRMLQLHPRASEPSPESSS